ncbi:MAG: hypothetical protein ABJG41_16025 [Cyclobacteriaceae bacterium]
MIKNISLSFMYLLVFTVDSICQPLAFDEPRAIIKLDLANAINPIDPSLLLCVEHFPSSGRFSLVHEAGFVVAVYDNSLFSENSYVDIAKSFKTRHEMRFYLGEWEGLRTTTKPYMSVDYQYRYLSVNEKYILQVDCGDGCQYYRNFDGNIPTTRHMVQLHFGMQWLLSPRISFDLNYGIGRYFYKVKRSAIYDGRFVESYRYLREDRLGLKTIVTAQMKLGYVINK